ncbi:MAG: protein kinase [Vicinamibacterales bacterium]
MALTPGTRLGPYEVLTQIGVGGMGEVYRATDTKLKRQVAIKVLPASVAGDAERLARFQREAEVLAALNHPNIAAIHGLEESDGIKALVMELVEGPTLADRIAHGAIPIDEALPIAKQIAEALEAAHEQGIIHRDLKPANIKVRADGTVKVLDFGLAKAVAGAAPEGAAYVHEDGVRRADLQVRHPASQAPTITTPAMMTGAGMILGTAAYMSPEQARGKAVDKRADIWAFGAVLFEMLSGTRPFDGEDVAETLGAVIHKEPVWSRLPATTPVSVRAVLQRCLQKEPRQRLRDIGDVRLALEGAFETAASLVTTTTSRWRGQLPWMAALSVAAALVAALAVPALRYVRQMLPPEMRVEITTPPTDVPLQFALSPDGRFLVFVAPGEGSPRLWLRPLDQTEVRPLAGTEGASNPFWSPDSRSIGFFAAGKLLRLDLTGGAPQALAIATAASSNGSWGADGTILFARQLAGPLSRVAAAGGEPSVLTQLDPPRVMGHRAPQFLPDGRHFLFYALGTPEAAGLYLGSLDGGVPTRLTAADSGGAFLPPDQVVFVRQGTLVARRLDLASATLVGDPVLLADRVGVDANARGGFAVSGAGAVAYRAGGGASRQLTWFDRPGTAVGTAGEPDANDLRFPEISPDGRRVAMTRTVQGNADVWLLDLVRGGMARLTFDAARDVDPVWSPDGTRVAFSSNRTGTFDLYMKPSNGSGTEERLVNSPNTKQPQDWSPDGRWLVYYEVHPTSGRDLWVLDMAATDHAARVVANTSSEEVLAAFSPDGRWVAYQTNESGRFEVVVQPFPDTGSKWQVSTGGGVAPRWRADGQEIYFLAPDATLMAVSTTAAGGSFEAGTPAALFPTRIVDGGTVANNRPQYAVARDGRFLINQPVGDATASPIMLLMNWTPEAKR